MLEPKMSDADVGSKRAKTIEFDPILPETGLLFFEECPVELEIERPKLLPLKTSTQLRFEQLQQEASRAWRKQQKEKTAEIQKNL